MLLAADTLAALMVAGPQSVVESYASSTASLFASQCSSITAWFVRASLFCQNLLACLLIALVLPINENLQREGTKCDESSATL